MRPSGQIHRNCGIAHVVCGHSADSFGPGDRSDLPKTWRPSRGLQSFRETGRQELDVTNAQLTFPGVVLNGKGKVRDRNGNFGEINLDLAKSELKELVKLVPSAGDLRLSGPIEATIGLKKAGADVVPEGVVRLIAVDYRPPNAGWTLENIKGLVEPHGTAVKIPG